MITITGTSASISDSVVLTEVGCSDTQCPIVYLANKTIIKGSKKTKWLFHSMYCLLHIYLSAIIFRLLESQGMVKFLNDYNIITYTCALRTQVKYIHCFLETKLFCFEFFSAMITNLASFFNKRVSLYVVQ